MLFSQQVTSSQVYQIRNLKDELIVIGFDGAVVKLDSELKELGRATLSAKECHYAHKDKGRLICDSTCGETPHCSYIDVLDMGSLEVRPLARGLFEFVHAVGEGFVGLLRQEDAEHRLGQLSVARLDVQGEVVEVLGQLEKDFKDVLTAQLVKDTIYYAHQTPHISLINLDSCRIRAVSVPQCSCLRSFDIYGDAGAVFLHKNKTFFITR